jgi:transposase-like protein
VAFLRDLVARGLSGVRLAISDEHQGLKAAIARVLACPWQHCTGPFTSCATCTATAEGTSAASSPPPCGKSSTRLMPGPLASASGRSWSASPNRPQGRRAARGAEEDLLAFYRFPSPHWSKLRSTNPLERVNREVGRRSDVVGIFPNDAAALRLAGALLIEQCDEWLVARRYLSVESIALVLEDQGDEERKEVVELQAA